MSIIDQKPPRPNPHHATPKPHPRPTKKPHPWVKRITQRLRGEKGMSTAEYAVGTLAAVAFAGILLNVLTSGAVQNALSQLIQNALG